MWRENFSQALIARRLISRKEFIKWFRTNQPKYLSNIPEYRISTVALIMEWYSLGLLKLNSFIDHIDGA